MAATGREGLKAASAPPPRSSPAALAACEPTAQAPDALLRRLLPSLGAAEPEAKSRIDS